MFSNSRFPPLDTREMRLVLVACALVAAGCAGVKPTASGGATGGSLSARAGAGGGSGGTPGTGGRIVAGTGGAAPDAGPPVPPITDFPPDPIFDMGAASTAPTLFTTAPRSTGAPCVLSPAPGTLMPRNWLRPRFSYKPSSGENLFEITLTVQGFAHPLVIYTTALSYTLDATIWAGLRISVNDQPIAVTVRALTVSGSGTVQTPPSPVAMADFTIAPVDAPGKIVYWAIPNGSSDGILRGFGIGEESVEDVLAATQLTGGTISTTLNDGCIGCHAATPDGLSVGFQLGPHNNSGPDSYYDSVATISGTVGQQPSWATNNQLATIRALRGIPAFSRSHWTDGDHVELLMDANNQGQLLWVNMDTDGAQGTIARTGDPGGATEPSFSHDGTRIVYVSANAYSFADGRLGSGPGDLYTVPYGNRTGGTATSVSGASDPSYTEYYPAFSPDDAYIAFTRFSGNGNSYSNNQAEVFVVPAAGGQAIRFGANDPPACQGVTSPGVTNDWPKWSPEATAASNGKTYYWVTFSSTRDGRPQLYVAPMTVSAGAVNVDYPALYLWNQPSTDDNHTPSWDDYQIPPIVIGLVR